ncbi:MAG: ABC transporter permease [Clostridiales bacterium]|nr:ABC transporter permease [Clostridiales bacterium]
MKKLLKSNGAGMLLLMVLVVGFFGALNPTFLRPVNLIQYINNGVVLAFLTFGLAATVISGNFDYSIGSMTGFGTVILALMLRNGVPLSLSLLLGFLILMLFGVLNGFIVGYLRVPGMLGTLGTSSLIYGIALVLTQGQAIGANSDIYKFFGKSDLGTLPFGIPLLAVVFVLSVILFDHTQTGRNWYFVGTSSEVARYTGIDPRRTVMYAHMYSAAMCFCGALVLGSRMASGRADIAEGYVLQAVTAAVFGGISIKGGHGRISGALLGVLIFTLLTSGFTMINLSQYYKQVSTGVLLVLILILRNYRSFLPDAFIGVRRKRTEG